MAIETSRDGVAPVYERFADRGRMLPPGLEYPDSWIDASEPTRCFQLMETHNPTTLTRWTAEWEDLVGFEIVPVIGSDEAAAQASAPEGPPDAPLP